MEVNPLNIFFVKSDSKGDRLLFRYPYTTDIKDENTKQKSGRQNPYAISVLEDLLQCPQPQTSNISKGQLSGFTDEMLSTLFAVKAELCNSKFELKVNDVRFVGHPTLLTYRTNNDDSAAMIVINIVFALQASASHTVVKCYYDLSKRLGKALRYEEKRYSYLTEEMRLMLAAHDEISALDTECNSGENEDEEENSRHSVSSSTHLENIADTTPKSAFHLILQRSSLARSMKAVFEELTKTGIVQVRINNWILLSFCLPHKAHQIDNMGVTEPENIDKCLQRLRPYHGILLMVNPNDLLNSIPLDSSPALLRLIKMYSPLKSLQTLAIEADLSLTQVFQLTGHLVYWAKATVIYPLCEGNVYVIAPGANIYVSSSHVEEFAKEFPGLTLMQVLIEFSLPAPLWYHSRGHAGGADGTRLARVTAWLLRRRMLLQIHTYVKFNGVNWGVNNDQEYYCEKHEAYYKSNSVSYSSLNQIQLNVPEPVEPRSGSKLYDYDEGYPTENKLNQMNFSYTKPIIITSAKLKYDKFEEPDSANHSFQDDVDIVDGIIKTTPNCCDYENNNNKEKTINANSVDSGISNNVNSTKNTNDLTTIDASNDMEPTNDELTNCISNFTPKISDLSLNIGTKECNSDNDIFEVHSDGEKSPKQKGGVLISTTIEKKNGVSLNLKLQNEMSFQSPTVWNSSSGCDVVDACRLPVEPLSEETALEAFTEEERAIIASLPAAQNPEDLLLLAQLHKKGYFQGEHHLEEIMFMENVSRSQLMQLLDKFREVLITVETEDPAVAMLYPY
ncbi:GATOR complex protein NPRL3 [Eumeta japonica]|uniref:GATOR complex protein NPRL3 n=1 Tax=Eumeta variegata TaxID=151549 RepID=A0A4C1WCE6_EUMVA|nr:GATOR complex protein NPRL3 [Eumeta japonica]